jgi:hypothetical protein
MGCSLWHNRCFHDCLVHVVFLGFGENWTPRRSTNVDGALGSSRDDHGRRCRNPAICRGRSDNEFPSRRNRTIASQLCRPGQSSGIWNSDFTVWLMGGGRVASSTPECARGVLAATHRLVAGCNRESFHRVESGIAAIARHLDRYELHAEGLGQRDYLMTHVRFGSNNRPQEESASSAHLPTDM